MGPLPYDCICPVKLIILTSRIIEPLASRCSKFRFKPLDMSSTSIRLQHIATEEHVPVSPPVIDALISVSGGDLRRAITYLQSASRLSSSTEPPTAITVQDIQEIAGVVPDNVINGVGRVLGVEIDGDNMDVDSNNQKTKLSPFDSVQRKVKELMREGYSAAQLLSQVSTQTTVVHKKRLVCSRSALQLHDLVIIHPTLNARKKSQCALVFAEADKALCDGADEELWILEVGLKVQKALASEVR